MKTCNKCSQNKSLNDFSKSNSNKDGYMKYCKVCHGLQNKANRGKYKEYDKKYAKKNWLLKKDDPNYQLKHKEYQRQYKRQKRKDPIFRLKENLRTYFYRTITNKSNSIFKYLGDLEEFKNHIELQFKENMTWNNYGTYWEIDHIKPIEMFDFTNENEIQECWNYKNLQPLTINENRTKRYKK
jgi:hypothetical protein